MKSTAIFLVLLGIVFFNFGCSSTNDPQTTTVKQGISGTVTDASSGSPIAGVVVQLSTLSPRNTTTDNAGKYSFDNVAVGDYTVSFSKSNYTSVTQPVHADSSVNTVLNVSLSSVSTSFNFGIHVIDAETGQALVGATVIKDQGDTLKTDNNGNVLFMSYYSSGNSYFSANKYGYLTASNTVPDPSFGHTRYDTLAIQPYTNHLVACYRFSNSCIDSSGKGHDGTNHGCTFVADRFGTASSALQCNGSTSYVRVADNPDINFGKDKDFTICFWENTSAQQPTAHKSILVQKAIANGNMFTGYEAVYSDPSTFTVLSGTTYGKDGYNLEPLPYDGLWHFVCITFTRSTSVIVYYLDGKKMTDNHTFTNHSLPGNITTTADLLLGGDGTSTNAFKGILDDVKLYDVVLDANSVLEVYHENGW